MDEQNNINKFAPHLALLGVQMLFGTLPVIGKYVLQVISPLVLVGFRIGGAALLFIFFQMFSKGGLKLEKSDHYWLFLLYSLLGVTVNQLLFVGGLARTTATNTSLLAVLIPIFAFIISVILRHDRFTLPKVAGLILAASGVVYLIDPTKADFSAATTRGDLMIIVNCFSYACYIAVSKKLITHYGALKSMAWLFFFGALFTVPLGLWEMWNVALAEVSGKTWLLLGWIILLPTFAAYYLNGFALARVAPSIVAVYIYLQPLLGFASAVILLGEKLTGRLVFAAALIFGGLFFVTRKPKKDLLNVTYP